MGWIGKLLKFAGGVGAAWIRNLFNFVDGVGAGPRALEFVEICGWGGRGVR